MQRSDCKFTWANVDEFTSPIAGHDGTASIVRRRPVPFARNILHNRATVAPRAAVLQKTSLRASDREMLLHDFVRQLRDGALGDDAAPIQDRKKIGQLTAEFQVLLHQKDRDGLLS